MGLAFQIVDDILGAAGTFKELGRDPGRDQIRGKVTYPSVVGFPASHRAVGRLLGAARGDAACFGRFSPLLNGFTVLLDRRRRDAEGRLLGPGESS